nr:50S ribosomal protein L6 [Phycisphaerae bacterium]
PEDRLARQMHGTTRALIANMVRGVAEGYSRKMEIYGTGFNVKEQGGKLVLTVGYCKPVEVPVPKAVKVQIEVPATKGNDVPAKFSIHCMDRCVLGEFAAAIRRVRPPEPYQGKGIRYADEHIKKKVGKAFASGSGA